MRRKSTPLMTPSSSAPGIAQRAAAGGAERQEHRRELVAQQVADREVAAESPVQAMLDAQLQHLFHLRTNHVPREAILGHALVEHSAEHRRGFEQHHAIAEQREVVRAAHPGRARPDHRDTRRPAVGDGSQAHRPHHRRRVRPPRRALDPVPLGHRPLQGPDRDGLVDQAPAARRFAGMGADPSAGGGQGIRRPRDRVGTRRFAFTNRPHVPPGVCPHGAAAAARHQVQEVPGTSGQRLRTHDPAWCGSLGAGNYLASVKSTVAPFASTVIDFC